MPATILDVDGTLVDTNYQHALAWHRALKGAGYLVQLWRIHRHIGMGGDQTVAALIGEMGESLDGKEIRAAQGEIYAELIDEVEPMEGARELIEHLSAGAWSVVLASSANPDEIEHYLELLDAHDLVDCWTSAEDVVETKPAPDLVEVAMAKVDAERAIMVGDSTWDIRAAQAAGIPTIAVLSGGFSRDELSDAGAIEVVESVAEVAEALSRLPVS